MGELFAAVLGTITMPTTCGLVIATTIIRITATTIWAFALWLWLLRPSTSYAKIKVFWSEF